MRCIVAFAASTDGITWYSGDTQACAGEKAVAAWLAAWLAARDGDTSGQRLTVHHVSDVEWVAHPQLKYKPGYDQ